jgi:hypothetical protein
LASKVEKELLPPKVSGHWSIVGIVVLLAAVFVAKRSTQLVIEPIDR